MKAQGSLKGPQRAVQLKTPMKPPGEASSGSEGQVCSMNDGATTLECIVQSEHVGEKGRGPSMGTEVQLPCYFHLLHPTRGGGGRQSSSCPGSMRLQREPPLAAAERTEGVSGGHKAGRHEHGREEKGE